MCLDSQTRSVQLVQLGMLKELIAFFKKENISYFAVGGTVLGAVRHKGFIPWDDDIDIALKRHDYERFLSLQHKLPEYLQVHTFETDPKYYLFFAKVKKKGTIFVEKRDRYQKLKYQGVFIDIFPLDGDLSESNKKEIKRLYHKRRRLIKQYVGFFAKVKSVFYRWIYPSIESLNHSINDIIFQKKNESEVRCWSNIFFHGDDFYVDKHFPIQQAVFEGILINIPGEVDDYLIKKYGDYMTIPPKKDRRTHNPIEIQLD